MDDLLQSPLMSGQGTFAFTRPDSEATALEGAAFGATFDALLIGTVPQVPPSPGSVALASRSELAVPEEPEGALETPLVLPFEGVNLASGETPILPNGVSDDVAASILKSATPAVLAINAQFVETAPVADAGDIALRTLPISVPVASASPRPINPAPLGQSVVNQPPPISSNTVVPPHVAEPTLARAAAQTLPPATGEFARQPQATAQVLPVTDAPEPQTLPVAPDRPVRATSTGPLTIPSGPRTSPQAAPLTIPPAAREVAQAVPGVERSAPQTVPQTLPTTSHVVVPNAAFTHSVSEPAARDQPATVPFGSARQTERTAVAISDPQTHPTPAERQTMPRNQATPILPPNSAGPQAYGTQQQTVSKQPAEAAPWQNLPQGQATPQPVGPLQTTQPVERAAPAATQRAQPTAVISLPSQASPVASRTGAPVSLLETPIGQEPREEAVTVRVGGWTIPAARTASPYVLVPQQSATAMPVAPSTPPSGAEVAMDALPDIDSALQPLLTPASSTALTPTTSLLAHAPFTTAQMIAQQIASALPNPSAEGDSPLELALDPPELGRVRMQMAEVAGVMTLTIQAERPETADLMRRHLDLLAQEFSDAGLESPSVHISQDGAEHQGGADGDSPTETPATNANPTPDDGALPQPNLTAAGGLDLRL